MNYEALRHFADSYGLVVTHRDLTDRARRAMSSLPAEQRPIAEQLLQGGSMVGEWTLCRKDRGRVQVEKVAAELGWSRRYLTERFSGEVGLSPKTFARVLRFRHAVAMLNHGAASLTEISTACGFPWTSPPSPFPGSKSLVLNGSRC